MKFDDIFEYTGNYGFYHRIVANVLSLVLISNALTNFGTVFLNGNMDHFCRIPESVDNSSCNATEFQCGLMNLDLPIDDKSTEFIDESKCRRHIGNVKNESHLTTCENGWVYDRSNYKSTIVSEFDLVCEDSYKVSLAASSFLFGYFFGAVIFGTICDYFGRKRGIILALFLRTLSGIVLSISPTYWFYFIFRAINGCMNTGLHLSIFVYLNELVAPSKRAFVSGLSYAYFSIGVCILALVAYFMRSWRTFYIFCSVCSSPLLIVYIFLPESPRWLLVNNRPEEAKAILKRIAKFNKIDVPDDAFENLQLQKDENRHEKSRKSTLLTIFRYPNLRKTTLVLIYIWFTSCLIYYGFTYGAEGLDVNLYISMSIFGLMELACSVATWITIQRFGRRQVLMVCLLTTGIMCFANIWISSSGIKGLSTILSMTGRFFVSMAFAVLYIFTTELYSTDVRAMAVGFFSFMSRFAGVLAPQVLFLERLWKPLPLVVFSFTSISAGLLLLLLPDTLNLPLPQTTEEAEMIKRRKTRFRSTTNNSA